MMISDHAPEFQSGYQYGMGQIFTEQEKFAIEPVAVVEEALPYSYPLVAAAAVYWATKSTNKALVAGVGVLIGVLLYKKFRPQG